MKTIKLKIESTNRKDRKDMFDAICDYMNIDKEKAIKEAQIKEIPAGLVVNVENLALLCYKQKIKFVGDFDEKIIVIECPVVPKKADEHPQSIPNNEADQAPKDIQGVIVDESPTIQVEDNEEDPF